MLDCIVTGVLSACDKNLTTSGECMVGHFHSEDACVNISNIFGPFGFVISRKVQAQMEGKKRSVVRVEKML